MEYSVCYCLHKCSNVQKDAIEMQVQHSMKRTERGTALFAALDTVQKEAQTQTVILITIPT